jgi:acyl-CoA synthetase (AMP-forming)/AMP-acid ligase II
MSRLAEDIRTSLLQRGDRPILFDMSGRSLTGNELVERVDKLAGSLLDRKVGMAPVGLWYRNCFAAIEAFLAVEWIGGTRIAVDPNAQPAEAIATFRAAGVELVIADRAHESLAEGMATLHDDEAPWFGKPHVPVQDVSPHKAITLYPRAVSNGKLFSVPFSYGNWDAIIRINLDLYRRGAFGPWNEDSECFLAAQQIMHATGFLGTFPFLLMGRPQVLAGDFVARHVVDAIEKHQVTTTMLVPQMLTRLVAAADEGSASAGSLRHVLYGGGPVQLDDVKRALHCFGPTLSQVYGRMEGGWPIAILGTEEHQAILSGDDRLASSCGRPIDQVSIRLRPISAHEDCSGELCVASTMTVQDYKGADGFCSLGDIMYQDEQGYLFYRGRLDRMINTGYHIYPAEIEEVIGYVPGVAEVLVVGEKSREWGETVVAYIVPDAVTLSYQLIDRVREELIGKLARYKIPREFRIVEELPDQ